MHKNLLRVLSLSVISVVLTGCGGKINVQESASNIDANLPFDEAMVEAIKNNSALSSRFKLSSHINGEYASFNYSPPAFGRSDAKLASKAVTEMFKSWCFGNNAQYDYQYKYGRAAVLSKGASSGYRQVSEGSLYCYKDNKDIAIIEYSGSSFSAYPESNVSVAQEIKETGDKERAERSAKAKEERLERKRLEEERLLKLAQMIQQNPTLGTHVGLKTCQMNSRGECVTLSSWSNGQIMQISGDKVLVRLFNGEELWVDRSDLNAPH